MSEDQPEYEIINGQIISEPPGVKTETPANLSAVSEVSPLRRQVPQQVQDAEPEALAAAMADCVSRALDEEPVPSPMDIVNRLLRLKTANGHKIVWTRFDIHQLYALWTNKLSSRIGRPL